MQATRLRWLGVLDRYVLKQWLVTFVLSAVGVPAVAVLIDLSERFGKLSTERHIPVQQILLGQLYLFPSKMTILVPAAVLFATVFTLNGMGRHSELTAVQGGGVSFYRLIAPMLLLATLCVPGDYALQELAGYSTTRHNELHKDESSADSTTPRSNFAYASRSHWTFAIKEMFLKPARAVGVMAQTDSSAAGFRWTMAADSATWKPSTGQWTFHNGATYQVSDTALDGAFRFKTLRINAFTELPQALMTEEKKAEEMTTPELKRYLANLKASGAKPQTMAVELPLKYSVPVACLVVALFGAPLAITNARAIALGTTLAYLTGTQIMKAIGGRELVSPFVAAWSMNVVFLVFAVILLWRVRS
jgi:lipopolysaccharide export system permease protein